jgi:hypothetical protein
MSPATIDAVCFSHSSSGGLIDIIFDVRVGEVRLVRGGTAIETPVRMVELSALVDLAARVTAADASLQPTDVSFAQHERLVVRGGSETVAVEVFNGEIVRGAAGELVGALRRCVGLAS